MTKDLINGRSFSEASNTQNRTADRSSTTANEKGAKVTTDVRDPGSRT